MVKSKGIKSKYDSNKAALVGDECVCPSCGTIFIKTNYQQAFCKSRIGTKCKDKYWNTVTPNKRNNTTRISPASRAFMVQREENSFVDEGPEGWDGHKDY